MLSNLNEFEESLLDALNARTRMLLRIDLLIGKMWFDVGMCDVGVRDDVVMCNVGAWRNKMMEGGEGGHEDVEEEE